METEEERRTRLENDAFFLKGWQLCISFKLDVLTHRHSKYSYCLLLLIFLMYIPNNLYIIIINCIILIKKIIINKS